MKRGKIVFELSGAYRVRPPVQLADLQREIQMLDGRVLQGIEMGDVAIVFPTPTKVAVAVLTPAVAEVSVKEAAKLLFRTEDYVRKLCQWGKLKCRKDEDGHWLIPVKELERIRRRH